MSISQGPGPAGISRVMLFIDGGYLREGLKVTFGDDKMNFRAFTIGLTSLARLDWLYPHLLRAYYYDALPDAGDPDYEERNKYVEQMKGTDFIEVRLGRLRRSTKNNRQQKGVDTLIAIDMLTKAYLDHYDIGILVTGDDDFRDLARALSDALTFKNPLAI